jgi:predicted metal-dependent hydrolase
VTIGRWTLNDRAHQVKAEKAEFGIEDSVYAARKVPSSMSHKSAKLEALVEPFKGQELDPYYLAFFDCFNRQLYFEAHEVLEVIWLGQRKAPKGRFYQGLIQLAGAFVHLQKDRLSPAAALFRLAHENLRDYPVLQDGLDVSEVLRLIERWQARLEDSALVNPLSPGAAPLMRLQDNP